MLEKEPFLNCTSDARSQSVNATTLIDGVSHAEFSA